MPQVIINNGDSGLVTRNNLNNMFTELYTSVAVPIKLENLAANASQAIVANTYVYQVSLNKVSGSPIVRIGTTPNGTDILGDTTVGAIDQSLIQQYFGSASTFYITFTASCVVNVRFDVVNNFF